MTNMTKLSPRKPTDQYPEILSDSLKHRLMASILHAMPKHDFGRLVLRVSGEGEKARVYASTKPPRQALTRSINRLAGLKPASSTDLRDSFPVMNARTRGSSLNVRINSKQQRVQDLQSMQGGELRMFEDSL
jgi:hypothetical protein